MTKHSDTKNIFKAFLLEKASFDGDEEIPLIKRKKSIFLLISHYFQREM